MSPADPAICLRELGARLGADRLLTARGDLSRFETGARYGAGRAAFAILPRRTEEVSAAIQICLAHGVALVPQGGNTGLVGAASPDDSGTQVILSLEKLTEPLRIDPANRSASVPAGLRLSALNAALAKHGLTFPIDLAADPTLGGMIATNTGGARLLRYGDVRRAVLGLEVVLARPGGEVLDFMGGLRKDNAGPDLKQLFIGSGGAFGVVTRAEIEVQRLLTQSATALAIPASRATVPDLLAAAEEAFGETLASFEGMSRNAMACVFRHVPAERNPFAPEPVPDYAVLIEAASANGEANLSARLEAFLFAQYERGTILNAVTEHPERIWGIRHAISEALRQEGTVLGLDISVRRGDLPAFHKAAYALIERDFPWLTICDFGHCGDGGDHFNLVWSAGGPPFDVDQADAARAAIYALVTERFG
ncbi:MAG TPA: FAD-binding oxidoreductase, partial [Alphaproteobacteria bacterium]|nr:FAD-binding oxidoreductase [Alphaproteobacteria bacterium]